jgi:hypothetical protein
LLASRFQFAPKEGIKKVLESLDTVPGINPNAGGPDGLPETVYSRFGLNHEQLKSYRVSTKAMPAGFMPAATASSGKASPCQPLVFHTETMRNISVCCVCLWR